MHPDELLEQLKASATPRKARNLDIIHAVCREQHERGSSDFSVATISRIAQERGGPVKSTIHNKTGDDFKGLIQAWAGHTGGATRKVRKVSENPVYAVLDKIPDPAVRGVMGAVLAENKKLRGEVNLLKANTEVVIDQRTVAASQPKDTIQILPASTGLTDSEKEALRYAISEKLMQDEGWTQDDHGRVLNPRGRAIYKVGYVTAIRKIVGTHVMPADDSSMCTALSTSTTRVQSGRASIAVEHVGSGQAIVFLHAAIADRRMWRHQVSVLGGRYKTIAYDRRGCGETHAVDAAYSNTGDLKAVLDHLVPKGEKAILVGCSQGGGIAIDAALEMPDRISALLLISPSVSGAPAPETDEVTHQVLKQIEAASKSGEKDAVNQLKAKLFLDGPYTKHPRVQGVARFQFLEMHRIILDSQGISKMLPPCSAWDQLRKIQIPIRILCGDLDVPYIQERSRWIAESVEDGRCEALPGMAHLPSIENPEFTTGCLEKLLSEVAPVRTAI